MYVRHTYLLVACDPLKVVSYVCVFITGMSGGPQQRTGLKQAT